MPQQLLDSDQVGAGTGPLNHTRPAQAVNSVRTKARLGADVPPVVGYDAAFLVRNVPFLTCPLLSFQV